MRFAYHAYLVLHFVGMIRRLRRIRQRFASILLTLNLTPNQNYYLSHSLLFLHLLYVHSSHKNHISNTSSNTYFN